jgi:hypothetical protein
MRLIETVLSAYVQIFKQKPLLTIFSIVIYAIVAVAVIYFAESEKRKLSNSSYREMVASEIVKSIQVDADVDTLSNQIKVIFNSYDRRSKGELSEYGLVALLEDSFAQNASNPKEKDKLKILMELIAKQKVKDPYYGLKFEQKIIIKSLEREFIPLNESDNTYQFVDQVKEIVRRQNTEIDELKKNSTWGLPLGIAGVILTVIFGILGLLYPFISRKKANNAIIVDS